MRKRRDTEGPFDLLRSALRVMKWWVPLLILVSGASFLGMVVFAVLWWVK